MAAITIISSMRAQSDPLLQEHMVAAQGIWHSSELHRGYDIRLNAQGPCQILFVRNLREFWDRNHSYRIVATKQGWQLPTVQRCKCCHMNPSYTNHHACANIIMNVHESWCMNHHTQIDHAWIDLTWIIMTESIIHDHTWVDRKQNNSTLNQSCMDRCYKNRSFMNFFCEPSWMNLHLQIQMIVPEWSFQSEKTQAEIVLINSRATCWVTQKRWTPKVMAWSLKNLYTDSLNASDFLY